MKAENLSRAWNVAAGRITVLLTILLLSFAAKADFSKSGFMFRFLENGNEVEIYGWTGNLEDIKIPGKVNYGPMTYTVTRIAEYAFEGVFMQHVEIPNTVTEIGAYAFSGCRQLRSVAIPTSVKAIGENAFDECNPPYPHEQHEVKVQISDLAAWCDIDFANKYANPLSDGYSQLYLNGEKIYNLVIPDGVTTIKQYAFCSNFLSVTFPPSVKEIGAGAISGYEYEPYDTPIIYLSDLAAWCKVTGDIPRAQNHYLNGELLTDLVIPEGVTTIPVGIFSASESIKSVTIPNTVAKIEYQAFMGCYHLKSVTISNSVKEIDRMAFMCCYDLEKVTIGNSIRTLGDQAFDGCDHIKDIFIGNPVSPTVSNNTFSCYYEGATTLHVPVNSKPDYYMSPVWSRFPHIVEFDASGVEDVGAEEGIGFSVSGGVLTVKGIDGEVIEIYDMSGRLVHAGVELTVSGLSRGFYLLKAGNRTAKIRI